MSRTYTLHGPASHAHAPAHAHARRTGFSPRQQAIYRRIVEDAWRAVCAERRDVAAKEKWYREVLHEKLGVFTSKQLNKTGDFERACAAFEEIAGNSIYWQLRVNAGPLERMRRKVAEFVRKHEIEEAYIEGIARQMFDTHSSNLTAPQLNKLIAAIEIHLGRKEPTLT